MNLTKKILGLTSLSLLTLALIGCGAPAETTATNNAPPSATDTLNLGGDLVWVSVSDAVSFDPHRVNDIPSMVFQAQVFQGLLSFDEVGNLIPVLATDYRPLNPYTWEFDLRQGVTFHDGTPFNADAVVMNFERILDPNPTFPIPASNIKDMIVSTVAVDDYTVHITTEFPFAPLPAHLTPMGSFIIAPSAIQAERDGVSYVSDNPIGTGPFVLSSRVHGDHTVFAPNVTYWGGAPYVDSLTIRVIPDAGTRLAMLEAGDTHGFTGTAIDVPSVRMMANANYFTIPSAATEYIGFNTERGPLANPLVRQAISYAINRAEMIMLMEGIAVPATSMAGPTIAFAPTGLSVVEQDLERARELLAQTPYANGLELSIWVNDGSTIRANIAELTQFYLAQVGINLTIENIAWSTYLAGINDLEHDMFVLNWVATTGDADRAFHPLFHSENRGSMGNRFGYNNPLVDQLIEQGRRATAATERYAIYQDIANILAYDVPMLPLWHVVTPYFYTGMSGMRLDFRSIPYFARVTLR